MHYIVKATLLISLSFSVFALVTGCGQKGALYLPADTLPAETASPDRGAPDAEPLEDKAVPSSNQVDNNEMY